MEHTPLAADFFKSNRHKLLQAMDKHSIALLTSTQLNPPQFNPKYNWQQNTDFYYLTGINNHECSLILIKGETSTDEILFIPDYDALLERWEGEILQKKAAAAISGFDSLLTNGHFLYQLKKSLFRMQNLYVQAMGPTLLGGISAYARLVEELRLQYPTLAIKNLSPAMGKLRWQKTPEEITLVQRAIDITIDSFKDMAKKIRSGAYEYELEAELIYGYRRRGSSGNAFAPIIGSGLNSCFLHYGKNSDKLSAGQVLLVDSGAAYQNYNADITRTFPVGGKFSAKAEKYYAITLEVQTKVMADLRLGMDFKDYFKLCEDHQTEVFLREKIIREPKERRTYMMHNIGHSLGLDVHDPYEMDYVLKPGCLITVEPGIYSPEDGIGIRIEDDVYFNEHGPVNLSEAMPKSLADLYKLLG